MLENSLVAAINLLVSAFVAIAAVIGVEQAVQHLVGGQHADGRDEFVPGCYLHSNNNLNIFYSSSNRAI